MMMLYERKETWTQLHAEKIKMPRPFLIVSQPDYLIQVVDT